MEDELGNETPETHDCTIKLRLKPERRKEKVVIGCGAGFGGDRPIAALKLIQRVEELDYLVLECLAERTLAERYSAMKSGGKGYDPRRRCLWESRNSQGCNARQTAMLTPWR